MLNDREKLVLNAIIDFYLRFGETIGSRTLVKKYNIGLSSATIRNVMSDLEDNGFIVKKHSSSGRIPTDLGYKYYLDELLKIEKLSREEKVKINNEYERKVNAVDVILQQTSSLLSKLTNCASVVIEPVHRKENIKKIELVHINDFLVLAITVTEDMNVSTKKIQLEHPISKEKLDIMSERLNEQIKRRIIKSYEVEEVIIKNFEEYDNLKDEVYRDIEGKLYLNNSPIIFKDKNVNEVMDVLEMFSEEKDVKNFFENVLATRDETEGKVNVILGDELPIKGLEDFSFVYSTYKKGGSKGIIGVLGPKRMPYSKTMGIIEYISNEVEKVINNEKKLLDLHKKKELTNGKK
ncbi:MAG: heat-inducible transcriptional repressor HrcA [Fusobacterium sp. JB021]|nr:heat-inducible transcriptional repressor HrcA [Fusobacterium sp. JB021]MDP0506391.1 heat-inducible transcriptional repressor HrcA [Fusobacterium sp. JB019]